MVEIHSLFPQLNLSDNSGNSEWTRLAVLNNNVYCPVGRSTAYQSSFSTFLRNMLPQPF